MNVFLTGATGFVGSHLYEDLHKDLNKHSKISIYPLVRNPDKAKMFNISENIIKGSLNSKKANSWVEGLPDSIETVVHCAGLVHAFEIDDFYQSNFEATKILINDLHGHYPNKPLHFIFVSSLAACGPSKNMNEVTNENSIPCPVSHYGKSKLAAESFLINNLPPHWSYTIVRPPMIIGPRDPALLDIFKMVQDGKVLKVKNKFEDNVYSFIYVKDLTQILMDAIDRKNTYINNSIHTAHPQPITFSQLLKEIAQRQSSKLGPKKYKVLEVNANILNIVSKLLFFLNKIIKINFRLTPDKYHELKEAFWVTQSEQVDVNYKYDLAKSIELTTNDYISRGWLSNK